MAAQKDTDPQDNSDGVRGELARQAGKQLRRGRLNTLSDRLTGGPQRPGEQKVGRSPAVFLLTTVTVFGFLLAAIFWYINQQNSEDRLLKEAMTMLEQRKYLDAEGRFSQFLLKYPKTESTPAAQIGLHRSLVEKYIETSTPDVIRGMEEFRRLISECDGLPGYDELLETWKRYANRLAYAGAIVAELAQSEEALTVSRDAVDLLRRFSGEDGIPVTREEYLRERQRIAEQAIARKMFFAETTEKVDAMLAAGDTLQAIVARETLLARFPVLADDSEVVSMLTRILDSEKELIVRTDLNTAADSVETLLDPPGAVVPALRTQVSSDLVSQGRFLVTYGLDTCCSVDADTGDPRWRRVIGAGAPFAPLPISGSRASLLVFSTLYNEFWMLAEDTGEVLWRQGSVGRPVAPPVVVSESIYLMNDRSELVQMNSVSGRAVSMLTFPQKITGPPAVSSGNNQLIIPGDQTLVYTVSLSPFECAAVSHIPHGPDSVRTGVITAGRYFLFCDNYQANSARIRTLEIDENGVLSVVAEDFVDGHVEDPLLLRGYELYVPSSPQRITAFRVGDEPGKQPLAKVGANLLEEGELTRMHLLAGPGGQLWLAGRDLRKFRTRANSVDLDPAITAEGTHTQPIQLLEEAVFLTTRTPQSVSQRASSFLTRANRDEMTGVWRTLLASRIVAMTEAAGGENLLAVSDYGEVYRIAVSQLGTDAFILDTISQFRLPDKLSSEVGGTVLADGRPAAFVGAPEPAMWTFSTSGQLEQRWPLPGEPELPPVILDDGVVFASSGRLHLTGLTGGRKADDYLAAQTGAGQQPWKSMVAISGTQVLAVRGDNALVRVEYRSSPSPHLAEISVTAFANKIEQPLAAGSGFVAAATTNGKLLLMQGASLEVLAEQDLGGIASGAPQIASGIVTVDVAGQTCRIFRLDSELSAAGEIPLNGYATIGAPLETADGHLVARQDGTLFLLNSDGVPSESMQQLGQQLQSGLTRIGEYNVVVGLDGSIYSIDSSLQQ